MKSPYFVQVCKGKKSSSCSSACTPTTKRDGINISIQDIGTGTAGTFVLLHGLGGNAFEFDNLVLALAAQGFRTIALDLRGCGDSDKPYTPYDYDVWADDLRQILDCLKVENAILLGSALGASVAIHYAARHCCHRICKVIAESPSPVSPITALPPLVVAGVIAGFQNDAPATIQSILNLVFFPQQVSLPFNNNAMVNQNETPSWVYIEGIVNTLAANGPGPNILASDLPKVCVPTLIIAGALDVLVPVANADLVAQGIPDSTLVVFPNAGDAVLVNEQAAYIALVSAFATTGQCTPNHCHPRLPCKKMVGWHPNTGPVFEGP